jgi:hypothetical protein
MIGCRMLAEICSLGRAAGAGLCVGGGGDGERCAVSRSRATGRSLGRDWRDRLPRCENLHVLSAARWLLLANAQMTEGGDET